MSVRTPPRGGAWQPSLTGWSDQQAAAALAADGPNELPVGRTTHWPAAVLSQLTDTMIVVLLIAATLTAIVGDVPDMAVILTVVVLNSTLGAAQEVRSGHALAALADLTAPHATVVRSGRRLEVDARDVVRGDVLHLEAGDIVAADADIHTAEALTVDESALTGESVPVARAPGERVLAGTVVTRGRADAVAAATGRATVLGGIATSLRGTPTVATPLQRQLTVLGRRLAAGVGLAAVVVAALNLSAGRSVETSLVIAISLAVAAIPESLPAVVSLSLAMAAHRMAARGVLVRRLAAVEALGSVTILASDKTGTLTTGRMALGDIWTPSGTPESQRSLLEAAVLCSDARVEPGMPPGLRDDPTEVALVEAAIGAGVDVADLDAKFPRTSEEPFDAATARMTTWHADDAAGEFAVRKGSPEAIRLDTVTTAAEQAAAEALAARGQRVLAVATNRSGDWQLLGLLGLADPPRPDARAVVSAFRRAGVRPVMITGDHLATALAIARAVGIDDEADVHARVMPEQKSAIVAALQDDGEVVAMTGDGVNDAAALRGSSIGVAMGLHGTEVAKQAADIVLTGDDLASLVPAIAEGRRAYDNLRRFLIYGVSGGVAEILIMLAGPVAGFTLPLQAGQILWVNLLTHGLPGVAMGNEPAEADVLSRPPRPPGEQLLNRRTGGRIATLGLVVAGATLLAGAYARHWGHPWQSTMFLGLTFAQLAIALALRPRRTSRHHNRALLGAVVLNVVLAVLAVSWRPLQELLRTRSLSLAEIVPCLLVAVVAAATARWQTRH